MRAESARKHEELMDLLKNNAFSSGRAKEVEEWEKWRDLNRAQQASDDIISNPKSQIFAIEECDDGSRPEEHLDVLTEDEVDITGPLITVEDEPLMMLGSNPNTIKEDFSNDLDGQHSADKSKPYYNTLRCQIMMLKWGYVISIGQICTNVRLKQEPVLAQRRTWDPRITHRDILKQHLEDKVFLEAGVAAISPIAECTDYHRLLSRVSIGALSVNLTAAMWAFTPTSVFEDNRKFHVLKSVFYSTGIVSLYAAACVLLPEKFDSYLVLMIIPLICVVTTRLQGEDECGAALIGRSRGSGSGSERGSRSRSASAMGSGRDRGLDESQVGSGGSFKEKLPEQLVRDGTLHFLHCRTCICIYVELGSRKVSLPLELLELGTA
ncbi:hypothetical protein Tco_0699185 [Tanacetum coccineum]